MRERFDQLRNQRTLNDFQYLLLTLEDTSKDSLVRDRDARIVARALDSKPRGDAHA
jgi:hypothetical protein